MADDDYEIDFYGDAADDQQRDQEQHHDGNHPVRDEGNHAQATHVNGNGPEGDEQMDERRHSKSTEEPGSQQGVKRKSEELDDRPVDSGATAAIMISELNWWTTDDDIRGWLRQADCEQEVKELTFSEHKVNGKSKGQAYVEFLSRQSATAAKRHIDQLGGESNQTTQKKVSTSYWNPGVNPFRTLPKDAPARVKEQPRAAPSGPFNDRGGGNGFGNGGFRGRGGMNGNRGNMGQNNFNNRNFNGGGNMGFNNNNGNNMGGGFNGPMGGGGGGGNFGFNGRGNMMGGGMGGMRGGPGGMRGGRGGNMMGGMNPMGGMPMGMPMGMMGQGMPGFQGMNPNFGGGFGFGPNQGGGGGGGGDWGNPHGAKRPRPE